MLLLMPLIKCIMRCKGFLLSRIAMDNPSMSSESLVTVMRIGLGIETGMWGYMGKSVAIVDLP